MDSLDRSIAGIYSELNLATGSAEVVQRLGVEIRGLVQASGDPDLAERTLVRLASILVARTGPAVDALLDLIASLAPDLHGFGEVVVTLLGAFDEGIRDRVAALAADMARSGRLVVDSGLVERIAQTDGASPFSAAALVHVGEVVRRLETDDRPPDQVLALFRSGSTRTLRQLAARLLDAAGGQPSPSLVREQIGDAAADFLASYLEYSGATHVDLLHIAPNGATTFLAWRGSGRPSSRSAPRSSVR